MAVAFVAAFLLDMNPQLLSQFKDEFGPLNPARNELRQMELAFLLLIVVQWMAQGLIWHYYHYLKHRKAEQFYDNRPQPPRHGSFHISTLKRLQIGGGKMQMQNGK
jgi:hypothetical protein